MKTALKRDSHLQASGQLSKEQLAFFKVEEHGPDCLLELRFLDAESRQEGARYIANNRLSPHDSVVLARAIKEHQRRPDAAEGFSDAAGDCLAFKYFRDAGEMRSNKEKLHYLGVPLIVAADGTSRCGCVGCDAPNTILCAFWGNMTCLLSRSR